MNLRSKKLANLIKTEISNMILFGELKDPRIKNITITNVNVSHDISKATIFFTKTKDNPLDINEILDGFKKASGFIKRNLSKNMYIKRIPNLFFVYDDSLEYFDKIEEMLQRLKND